MPVLWGMLVTAFCPKIMPPTGNFHHKIVKGLCGVAKWIFDNTATFNARNDMFDANSQTGNQGIPRLLFWRSLLAFGRFLRLTHPDVGGHSPEIPYPDRG